MPILPPEVPHGNFRDRPERVVIQGNLAAAALLPWQQALASRDPEALLAINAWHLSSFFKLAPFVAEVKLQLRFSDLGKIAKATLIVEVLVFLRDDGEAAAAEHCRHI